MIHDQNDVSLDRCYSQVEVSRIHGADSLRQTDFLAVEEPLEIRLAYGARGQRARAISITMRTPGNDAELTVGFLFTEGILTSPDEVERTSRCGAGNLACVSLRPAVEVDLSRLERHFYTTSSCGVCGKTSLEAVQVPLRARCESRRPTVDADVIGCLPATLRAAQELFERTGGLHAAALFNREGELLSLREDVGRHNALDKLIGREFLAGRTPLSERILLLSGRVSFELVQKAAVAGIPTIAAIGAPSSLAVRLADDHGITLIGFVREGRFNVYTGIQYIRRATGSCPRAVELTTAVEATTSL